MFCCVKQHMHDLELLQAPVLVLPEGRCAAVPLASPQRLLPRHEWPADRVRSYLKLAELCEKPPYNMPDAAMCLRQLVDGPPADMPALAWLDDPAGVCNLPAVPGGNPFFEHLPQPSWRLLARFRAQQ